MKKIWIVAILVLFVGLIVVWQLLKDRNPLKVNVSHIKLEIKLERFDKMLNNKKIPLEERIQIINERYDLFFEAFNYDIISIGGLENRSYSSYLQTFLDDYAVREAFRAVDSVFSDVSRLEKELTSGFKHYKYYYRDEEIPRVIAFVAGFNHSIVTIEGFVGIGLDKYLGSGCELYNLMQIPDYAQRQMVPERIPFDVMIALAQEKYPYDTENETLLGRMIYEGKLLYFLDAMYPDAELSLKHAYREEDMQYCRRHERDMWAYIIDKKLLFETDYLTIRNFCSNSPYTKDFGLGSPPRVGNYLGWRIVSEYAKNNKVSVTDIMKEADNQKILSQSRYQP